MGCALWEGSWRLFRVVTSSLGLSFLPEFAWVCSAEHRPCPRGSCCEILAQVAEPIPCPALSA